MTYMNTMIDPKNNGPKAKTESAPPPTNPASEVSTTPEEATDSAEMELETIDLDELEDIEFLIDEIEDQIAPLAL